MSNSIKTGLFYLVEGAVVITRSKGVFKQAKVYERNGLLYAQHGGGFIRLNRTGTSNPNVFIDGLEVPDGFGFNKLGYMTTFASPEKAYDENFKKVQPCKQTN